MRAKALSGCGTESGGFAKFLAPKQTSSSLPGFMVDEKLCCALNNLEEAAARFEHICTIIYQDHIPVGSTLDENCAALFGDVKTELATAQGDIMHYIAVGLRPRIKADLQYMLHVAQFPLADPATFVDSALGPLLDDPSEDDAYQYNGRAPSSGSESGSNKSNPSSPERNRGLSVTSTSSGKNSAFMDRMAEYAERLKPSLRVLKSTDAILPHPAHDGYLCRNLIIISTHIGNVKTSEKMILFIWEQILEVMKVAMLTAKHPLPRTLQPMDSPYIRKAMFGYDKPAPKRTLPVGYQKHFSEILALTQEQLILFFNDDGDGVPYDMLIRMSERLLAPVLTCADMTTSAVIATFLTRASARHAKVIRKAVHNRLHSYLYNVNSTIQCL